MTNIDRAIREALSKEDAEFLARFEDHSTPVGEVLDTFRGRWGAMSSRGGLGRGWSGRSSAASGRCATPGWGRRRLTGS